MKTFLDWQAYEDAGLGDAYADIPKHGGNFAKAVAACINSRKCERDGNIVMCPSFQVSGNPHLSTGGRVKLLKAALSGDLPEKALNDPLLKQAIDLCLACKGCKRECENNVDMALIKSEVLAQQNALQGLSLRARLFGHLPRWLHRQPGLGLLVRFRNRSKYLAKVAERLLGLRADRALPAPAKKPFLAPAKTPSSNPDLPEVVLLADTFARYYEPAIAEAAIKVLHHAGYAVQVAEPDPTDNAPDRALCCGRTYLAQGMIAEARDEAARLVRALIPHVEAGKLVVGLEPSCVLGLRDDAQALGLGELVKTVAEKTLLFEEFLAREIMAKRLTLPLKDEAGTVPVRLLVHGHCHQKAVGAMKSMRRVLKQVPGIDVSMIEAGCCGMAGTFGLEKEHAALSDQMVNDALMPALKADPKAPVIANGFSCREQIRGQGDNRPRHLAEILAERLAIS